MNKNTKIVNHPLVQHKLTHIRNKNTNMKEFREYVNELSELIAYEVFKNIETTDIVIETPLATTTGKTILGKVNIFPILRAGQGMVPGFLKLHPNTRVGHVGLFRDEETLEPVQYLFKQPKDSNESMNIILDPMIATGGSAIKAIDILKEAGFENITFAAIVATPEALSKIEAAHPEVTIYVATIDERLDENSYIIPGLGDAGDRLFGTK
ncbi:MAG: uracil phosphoribosyltransferase [Tenericutes bacterium]|nr:MAG: uracil phosphoribosyltransferase [Mycoplasmatota bacterium]